MELTVVEANEESLNKEELQKSLNENLANNDKESFEKVLSQVKEIGVSKSGEDDSVEEKSFAFFAEALAKNQSIEKLYLGDYEISMNQIDSLFTALDSNKKVKSLNMNDAERSSIEMQEVANRVANLPKSSELSSLFLDSFIREACNQAAAESIRDMIIRNNNIKFLDLRNNGIDSNELSIIAEGLDLREAPLRVDLSYNYYLDRAEDALSADEAYEELDPLINVARNNKNIIEMEIEPRNGGPYLPRPLEAIADLCSKNNEYNNLKEENKKLQETNYNLALSAVVGEGANERVSAASLNSVLEQGPSESYLKRVAKKRDANSAGLELEVDHKRAQQR